MTDSVPTPLCSVPDEIQRPTGSGRQCDLVSLGGRSGFVLMAQRRTRRAVESPAATINEICALVAK
jgi:hypothetical protein